MAIFNKLKAWHYSGHFTALIDAVKTQSNSGRGVIAVSGKNRFRSRMLARCPRDSPLRLLVCAADVFAAAILMPSSPQAMLTEMETSMDELLETKSEVLCSLPPHLQARVASSVFAIILCRPFHRQFCHRDTPFGFCVVFFLSSFQGSGVDC